MESSSASSNNEINKILNLYLSKWKLILLFIFFALALAYLSIRYSVPQYQATATIKIKDDRQSQKLPGFEEVNGGGRVSDGTSKIKDEIQVMTSRSVLNNIVKNLALNVRYYGQGRIKDQELYENPPIKLNFFAMDSVVHKVDTTLYIKVNSKNDFLMFPQSEKSLMNREESSGELFSFGDRIKTSFGDIVIIPNVGKYEPAIGSNIKVSIKPIRALVDQYKSKITASTQDGSSVVNLTLQDNLPKKASDILGQIIKEYNKDVIADKEEVVRVTSEFINNRLELVFKELEEVDFTAEQIQKRNNLTALGAQANINLESERQNEIQINSTSNTIQLIDYLQSEISNENRSSDYLPSNIGIGDANIAQVTRSYNELVAERDKMLKNSTEKNPIVINLNNEINSLKENLEKSLDNIKMTSQITLNNLTKEDSRIRGQLYSAPTKQKQLRDIERQQGIKESLYLYLLEKREESAIRLGMYTPNAKIINNAYASTIPVSPKKKVTYLAAFLLGLMIPVGLIYVRDVLDTKIYDKDDLTKLLSIPYIGDIPKTSKRERLINKIDYSPKAESFRIIRSNIDFILKDHGSNAKKIFITSTRAQEGKSHTSTNLASSISFSGKSVLLIEMDIRVPKIMQYLREKTTTKIGLSDYLADTTLTPEDIVTKLKNNDHLDVIASGTIPPNPSELLMSDRVKDLFEYFDNKYDYIIADASAVGLVSDTLLISKFADMFIYVVGADNIDKRHLVTIAKPLYKEGRLPKMHLLLNGTNFGKKGQGYGYGYGNNPLRKKKWYEFR